MQASHLNFSFMGCIFKKKSKIRAEYSLSCLLVATTPLTKNEKFSFFPAATANHLALLRHSTRTKYYGHDIAIKKKNYFYDLQIEYFSFTYIVRGHG